MMSLLLIVFCLAIVSVTSLCETINAPFQEFSQTAMYRFEFVPHIFAVESYDQFIGMDDTNLIVCYLRSWYDLYDYEIVQENIIPSASAARMIYQYAKDNCVYWMTVCGTDHKTNQINIIICSQGGEKKDTVLTWMVYDISSHIFHVAISPCSNFDEQEANAKFLINVQRLYELYPEVKCGIWNWSGMSEMLLEGYQGMIETYQYE